MVIAFKNMNQFNETRLTVVIDTEKKTAILYRGQNAPIVDKRASRKKMMSIYHSFASEPKLR